MAKFCTKCGKPLQDGKPCSCTTKKEKEIAVKMQVDEDEEEIDESKVGSMLDDFMVVIKGMFKKPVNTIEKNLNVKNYNLALVSIVINLVLFGLLGDVFKGSNEGPEQDATSWFECWKNPTGGN